MMDKPVTIFEETYRNYLGQLGKLDFKFLASKMGVELKGGSLIVPFFGQPYRVSPRGISDPSGKEPIHSIKVVLCKYLLLYPAIEPMAGDWVSYKDFKEAAPFVDGYQNNTEKAIAKTFAGRLGDLKKACIRLGGRDPGLDWNYQVKMRFDPFPRIPLLLLFNDADEEFPAQCVILFERQAEKYLDMECLAILAWLLTDFLVQSLGSHNKTVM